MKKSLTLALVLVALAVFPGLGVAQQKSPPTDVETKTTTIKTSKSNGSERLAVSHQVVTGKVTQVSERNKTFAVEVTFSAAKLGKLPSVGQIVDITYTENPDGGPLEASNLNLSKSNIN